MTAINPRLTDTDRLMHALPSAPHDVYVEAMRRKGALLDSYPRLTKRNQNKAIADCEILTLVIRRFYAEFEGGKRAA